MGIDKYTTVEFVSGPMPEGLPTEDEIAKIQKAHASIFESEEHSGASHLEKQRAFFALLTSLDVSKTAIEFAAEAFAAGEELTGENDEVQQ